MKPTALSLAARYVFGLVSEPDFPRAEAGDWLQNLADAIGLVEACGDDEVQRLLAEAADSPLFEDEDEIKGDFLRDCIRTESGTVIVNLANTLIVLKAAMPEIVAYDEMACTTVLMKSLRNETNFAQGQSRTLM